MTSVVHRPAPPLPDAFGWLESGWPLHANTMRVEQYVDEDKYVIRVELPGIDPDKDIGISVHRGRLVLAAQRTPEEHGRGRSEFRYGTFTRSFRLPGGVRPDQISATYSAGIVEITMPAVGIAETRPVHIKVGTGT